MTASNGTSTSNRTISTTPAISRNVQPRRPRSVVVHRPAIPECLRE